MFVGVTGRDSAEAVAYFLLSITPAWASVAVLFVAACFVSVAMGTSVGTITLITPIAVAVANVSGFSLPLCIGSVMGGAMFGDNLSFISDTTIAACNTQGCEMRDKFRANFKIALPAAIVTLVLILAASFNAGVEHIQIPEYNLLLLIPYVLVLVGGIFGLNVFVVLLVGVFSGVLITLSTGTCLLYTSLCLHKGTHGVDFIQKEGAVSCLPEQAAAVHRAGVGPLYRAEQDAFHQIFWDGGAVDGHKLFPFPPEVMDALGQYLLASARLPGNEDGRVPVSYTHLSDCCRLVQVFP